MIKRVLKRTLGRRRTRHLIAKLRGRANSFLETEMILEYFERRPKGTMVDVGAHFGESFMEYLDDDWRILAFEPDPQNRQQLGKICDVRRIRLLDEAVSDKEIENASFFASDESSGISSLSAFRPTHHEVRRVRVTTLSKVLANEGIPQVDFLKIDTEGHDLFVLKGFPWEQQQPEVILCEFEDSKTLPLGYNYRTMGDFLVNKGYRVFLSEWYPIVRYGVQHSWRSLADYPANLQDPNAWGNFVAFRSGSNLQRIRPYLSEFAISSVTT